MSASKIAGTGASIDLGAGFEGHFRSFNWNLAMPEAETTGFADMGFFTAEPVGGIRVSGSVMGIMKAFGENSTPFPLELLPGSGLLSGNLDNQKKAMSLEFTVGCGLTFDGIVSGLSGMRAENGLGECTWNYGSNGVISATWDEEGPELSAP
jgi:hypothetical protein